MDESFTFEEYEEALAKAKAAEIKTAANYFAYRQKKENKYKEFYFETFGDLITFKQEFRKLKHRKYELEDLKITARWLGNRCMGYWVTRKK